MQQYNPQLSSLKEHALATVLEDWALTNFCTGWYWPRIRHNIAVTLSTQTVVRWNLGGIYFQALSHSHWEVSVLCQAGGLCFHTIGLSIAILGVAPTPSAPSSRCVLPPPYSSEDVGLITFCLLLLLLIAQLSKVFSPSLLTLHF